MLLYMEMYLLWFCHVWSLFCTLVLMFAAFITLFSPFFPSSSIRSHPPRPLVVPVPLLPAGGIKLCTAGGAQFPLSPLAVPSWCPPLSHKHMGAWLCQRPSWRT